MHTYRTVHRSTGSLSTVIPEENWDTACLSSLQLPLASRLGVQHREPFPSPCWNFLIGSILSRVMVGDYCELLYVTAMSCSEHRVLQHPLPYTLSTHSFLMIPEPWRSSQGTIFKFWRYINAKKTWVEDYNSNISFMKYKFSQGFASPFKNQGRRKISRNTTLIYKAI